VWTSKEIAHRGNAIGFEAARRSTKRGLNGPTRRFKSGHETFPSVSRPRRVRAFAPSSSLLILKGPRTGNEDAKHRQQRRDTYPRTSPGELCPRGQGRRLDRGHRVAPPRNQGDMIGVRIVSASRVWPFVGLWGRAARYSSLFLVDGVAAGVAGRVADPIGSPRRDKVTVQHVCVCGGSSEVPVCYNALRRQA
jgi:hypothetical protein